MRKRQGMTLIELMVVVGIILLLAILLLAAVNHARRTAATTGEKLDFQAIATALENYRTDFGDYPKNIQLTTWNSAAGGAVATTPSPNFLTLATALLGPGPGAPQTIQGVLTAGDGFDGPGIRTQTMNIPATASSGSLSFNTPLSVAPTYIPGQTIAWFDQETVSSGTATTHKLLGITSLTFPGTPPYMTANVTWSTGTIPTGAGVLRLATGKVWGPYLPPERFQVAYVDPQVGTPSASANDLFQPVLLDRWGGIIQYFPAYGPANNRYSASCYPTYYVSVFGLPATYTATEVIAGPLFGYAAPASIDTVPPIPPTVATPFGSYSIYDQRDGVPVVDNTNPSAPNTILWQAGGHPDLTMAVKWMLGDNNLDNFIDPYTDSASNPQTETLRNPNPYILISTGPDGPNRLNGGYCDLSSLTIASNATNAQALYSQAFQASGNIYNFDR